MNLSSRISRNSLSLISISLLARTSRWLALLVIVRFFDPRMVGQYALVITTAELFRVASDFGIDIVVTKSLLNPRENRSGLVAAAGRAKSATTTAAAILAVSTAVLLGFSEQVVWGVAVASLGFYVSAYTNLLRTTYEAELAVGRLVIPTIVVRAIYFASVVVGLIAGLGVVGVVLLAVVTDTLLLLYLIRMTRAAGYSLGALVGYTPREVFVSALPIGILGLVVTAYARLSTIVLAKLGGEVAVAYWTPAHRIAEAILLATGAFATSMLPVFSRYIYMNTSLNSAHEVFFPYLRKMMVLVTGAAIVLALFAEQIISLLFTPAYAEAAPALAVLGYWIVFASANMFLTNMLYAAERQRTVLSISSLCLVLNIGLCLYFIPILGFLGAAVAAAATELFNTALQSTAVMRTERFIRWGREYWMLLVRLGIWVFGLGTALVFLRYGMHPGVSAAIVLVYGLHLFLFRDFMLKDLSASVKAILSGERSASIERDGHH